MLLQCGGRKRDINDRSYPGLCLHEDALFLFPFSDEAELFLKAETKIDVSSSKTLTMNSGYLLKDIKTLAIG